MVDFGARSGVPTISADESQRLSEQYGPLAQAVRELIDATIRTEADGATIGEATAQVREVAERLRGAVLSESPACVMWSMVGRWRGAMPWWACAIRSLHHW